MIKKVKLTRKQVKAYEKLSGFKTTGKVEVHSTDDKVMDLLDGLYSKM